MTLIYGVAELTKELASLLENTFSSIIVEGEVTSCSYSSTGHCYFSLKENDSLLKGVIFSRTLALQPFRPKDGQKIRVYGSLTLYTRNGSYQIKTNKIQICGEGEQLALLEERKKRLLAEGLFDIQKKKIIPTLPKTIVVITSPTGAVIRDIIETLTRRHYGVHVRVLPTPVQGEEAPIHIANKISLANQYTMGDVIILARGGGSLEDLLPFSEEIVVRAIADSQIPIISAIGHETDNSLADLASDLRVPTPTAAAELVVESSQSLLDRIKSLESNQYSSMKQRIQEKQYQLSALSAVRLQEKISHYTSQLYLTIDQYKEKIIVSQQKKLKTTLHQIHILQEKLQGLSVQNILARGYVKVENRQRETIYSVDQLSQDEKILLHFKDGQVITEVKKKVYK